MSFSKILRKLIFRKALPDYWLPEGIRVYAIGDIHGRAQLLEHTLNAIAEDAQKYPDDRIIQVFLGDYIDRGIHSREAIELLLSPPPPGHERIFLKGNHEAILLEFLQSPQTLREWSKHGGFHCLTSYGLTIPQQLDDESLWQLHQQFIEVLPEKHLHFFKNLRISYELKDFFFVHAGINPSRPFEEQTCEDYLWIRNEFLNCKGFFSKYIIHGHSPVDQLEIHANRANLDVSRVIPSSLGCLRIAGNQCSDFTQTLAETA
jgi:serine/threonine protein phosphatase 1